MIKLWSQKRGQNHPFNFKQTISALKERWKYQISFCKYDEHAFLSLSNCVSGGVRRNPILSRLYLHGCFALLYNIFVWLFSTVCSQKASHGCCSYMVKALPLPLFVGPWAKRCIIAHIVHVLNLNICSLTTFAPKKGFLTWQIINGLSFQAWPYLCYI